MAEKVRCNCRRCTIRGLMGPAILITIGVISLFNHTSHDIGFGFGRLWPVILVVIGGMKLAESLASTEGHVEA